MKAPFGLLKNRLFRLGIPLAWRQLASEKKRFGAALAGVAFGVLLMMFELGMYAALLEKVVRPLRLFAGEVVIMSKNVDYFYVGELFTQRRLYQALASEDVASVAPLSMEFATWKQPLTGVNLTVCSFGVDPVRPALTVSDPDGNFEVLKQEEYLFFDRMASRRFGPVPELFRKHGEVETMMKGKRIRVKGFFSMGQTFAADTNVLMGERAFYRIFEHRPPGMINYGMIRLQPGVDPVRAAAHLSRILPDDVRVVTRENFIREEQIYWAKKTPIGFVFSAGVMLAIIVGSVVVYQILYADVNEHLKEYATLKAIGIGDRFLLRLIMEEATILSVLGFIPGTILTWVLYCITRAKADLPITFTLGRTLFVLFLTCFMCMLAGILATRKLRSADPADIF
jgi:putative ABC transport system permease protein